MKKWSLTILSFLLVLNTAHADLSASATTRKIDVIENSGTINVQSGKIINLLDPTLDQDAATKKYVDDQILAAPTGANAIDELNDVTITTPADGDVLVYETDGFVNQSLDSLVGPAFDEIEPLADVQVISYVPNFSFPAVTPVSVGGVELADGDLFIVMSQAIDPSSNGLWKIVIDGSDATYERVEFLAGSIAKVLVGPNNLNDSYFYFPGLRGESASTAVPTVVAAPNNVAASLDGKANVALDNILPTAPVSFNSQRISNVAIPTASTDVATKAYVDQRDQGLEPKGSVLRASTENVALNGEGLAPLIMDGAALVSGDRVLLKDQTDLSENGIYEYFETSGTDYNFTRTIDFDGVPSNEVKGGDWIFVEEGTVNALASYAVLGNGQRVVDTDDIVFTKISQVSNINQSLDNLSDVEITSPANGDILVYNSTGSVFENVVPNFANTALSNLAVPTAINLGLVPATNGIISLGTDSKTWDTLWLDNEIAFMQSGQFRGSLRYESSNISLFSVGSTSLMLRTGNVGGATASSAVTLESGNSGSGTTGNINIQTGTTSGTRGNINLSANSIILNPVESVDVSSKKIVNLAPATVGTDAVNLNQLNEISSRAQKNATINNAYALDDDLPIVLEQDLGQIVNTLAKVISGAGDDVVISSTTSCISATVMSSPISFSKSDEGTEITIMSIDPTYSVTIEDSRAQTEGCILNGPAVLSQYRSITLVLTDVDNTSGVDLKWIEKARNF